MLNRATLIGNVTKDPEMRYTPSGTAVMSFGLATNRRIKKGEEWESVATFHNIVVWGTRAESLAPIIKKGMKLYLEGRIENRSWEDEHGVKKYRSEIVADMIDLPKKSDQSVTQSSESVTTEPKKEGEEEIDIEEIPF